MWNIRLIIKLFFVFILTSPPPKKNKKSCRLIKINKAKKKIIVFIITGLLNKFKFKKSQNIQSEVKKNMQWTSCFSGQNNKKKKSGKVQLMKQVKNSLLKQVLFVVVHIDVPLQSMANLTEKIQYTSQSHLILLNVNMSICKFCTITESKRYMYMYLLVQN